MRFHKGDTATGIKSGRLYTVISSRLSVWDYQYCTELYGYYNVEYTDDKGNKRRKKVREHDLTASK